MKYELTENSIIHEGVTLYQIKRIDPEEYGGFIESESNLSQDGDCWISGEAKVWGQAQVIDNAVVRDRATVFGNATISENSIVRDSTEVSGDVVVSGTADILGDAKISGSEQIVDTDNYVNFVIVGGLSITVTSTGVRVGCMRWTRTEFDQMTPELAESLGVSPLIYTKYRPMMDAVLQQIPSSE